MTADVNTTIKSFSLAEVLRSIEAVLKKNYPKSYWVRCEISRIGVHAQSGHCYMELVDKNEKGIVAQVKAMSWADKYPFICSKFEKVTGNLPGNGMQVMLLCSVSFHPVHGISLMVTDIEPSFTLGEMARMKNEAIAKLKLEGIFQQNKQTQLPLLPGRLAIISVDTSRGYQDFIQTLQADPNHYAISWTLFDAILQGENAVPTLCSAIKKILLNQADYDAIAIIRGGAGETGLSCYDDYHLAKTIATCPLPFLTGIGHATNETVVEMVAHTSFITPTAAAQFFLKRFEVAEQALAETSTLLFSETKILLEEKKSGLRTFAEKLNATVNANVSLHRNQISTAAKQTEMICKHQLALQMRQMNQQATELKYKTSHFYFAAHIQNIGAVQENIRRVAKNFIESGKTELNRQLAPLLYSMQSIHVQKQSVSHLEEKIKLMSPLETLKRGYSITRHDGKAILDANQLSIGNKIEIEFANGKITTTLN